MYTVHCCKYNFEIQPLSLGQRKMFSDRVRLTEVTVQQGHFNRTNLTKFSGFYLMTALRVPMTRKLCLPIFSFIGKRYWIYNRSTIFPYLFSFSRYSGLCNLQTTKVCHHTVFNELSQYFEYLYFLKQGKVQTRDGRSNLDQISRSYIHH